MGRFLKLHQAELSPETQPRNPEAINCDVTLEQLLPAVDYAIENLLRDLNLELVRGDLHEITHEFGGTTTANSQMEIEMETTESKSRRIKSMSEAERIAVFMSGGFSKAEARAACEYGAAVVIWARA